MVVNTPSTTTEAERRGRWQKGALVVVGVLVFVPWALVTGFVASAFSAEEGDEGNTDVALLVVWSVLLLAPPAIVAWVRRGYWIWWAAGFPVGMVLAVGWYLTADFIDTEQVPGGAEDDLAAFETASAPTHVYYLGRRFHGWDLSDVVMFPKGSGAQSFTDKKLDPGDMLDIGYGDTCGAFASGSCGAELDLEVTHALDQMVIPGTCRRVLPAVRGGALPVESTHSVTFFTGIEALRVEEITWDGLGHTIAPTLREVGANANAPLPPPDPTVRKLVLQRCHVAPATQRTIP